MEIEKIGEKVYELLKSYSTSDLKPDEKIAIFAAAAKTIEQILCAEVLSTSLAMQLQKFR